MRFDYFAPTTVEEAISLLSQFGDEGVMLAGGTDVVIKIREQILKPKCVISLGRLTDYNYIRSIGKEGITIGAMTIINDIAKSPMVKEKCSIISQAARVLADPTIRNVATIGGNLCNAAPSSDMAPPLIALSAKVNLLSHAGERVIPLENFFTGPGATIRKTSELMTEIQVPSQTDGSTGVYLKHSVRGAADLAIVGVAVMLTRDSVNNVFTNARIVLGAVAPTPVRAYTAEKFLQGEKIDDYIVEKVAQMAADESSPIDDVRSSARYRREMVSFLVGQAIRQIRDSFQLV